METNRSPQISLEEYFKNLLSEVLKPEIEKLRAVICMPKEEQDIISIEEAEKITNLARQTIYQKVNRSEMPFLPKNGRKKLSFSKKDLVAWMAGKPITNSENNTEKKNNES